MGGYGRQVLRIIGLQRQLGQAGDRDRVSELAERITAAGIEVRGPVEHPGGDRSIYFRDPAGNLVEAWDYRDRGRRDGVRALE